MNTNCKRLIHVTFAIGVLVLALSASTPAAAATSRTSDGGFASWLSGSRGALAFILRYVAPVTLKAALPMGVVVDDGVPF